VQALTALELDPRLAAHLEARLGTRVKVVHGDGTQMPFEPRSFTTVTCFTMLHHIPSSALQDQLFREAFRVLRPGGMFAGADSVTSLGFRLLHWRDTMVIVDPTTLSARLVNAGFSDVDIAVLPGKAFRFRARKRLHHDAATAATASHRPEPRLVQDSSAPGGSLGDLDFAAHVLHADIDPALGPRHLYVTAKMAELVAIHRPGDVKGGRSADGARQIFADALEIALVSDGDMRACQDPASVGSDGDTTEDVGEDEHSIGACGLDPHATSSQLTDCYGHMRRSP
jgi:SAM-dependent methyltransferase